MGGDKNFNSGGTELRDVTNVVADLTNQQPRQVTAEVHYFFLSHVEEFRKVVCRS
jgi:hypothetical protein